MFSTGCSLPFTPFAIAKDISPVYSNTVFIAPTWDLTADFPGEVDEALLREGLETIRNSFGTGFTHGPYAQPGITFYCSYEWPLRYRFSDDATLRRNLRLAVETGLHFRIILHGGRFTGTDPVEQPLQYFLKTTTDDWLMGGSGGPYVRVRPGADTPPYVSLSRYNSVYYVNKMRNLQAAVDGILEWIRAVPKRQRLFIGFSKDPETVIPLPLGRTYDVLTQLEFESWRLGKDIYGEGHLTIPLDYHPRARGVLEVEIETASGVLRLRNEQFDFIGYAADTPRYVPFGLIIIDGDNLGYAIDEGTLVRYRVLGGVDDGKRFDSMVWNFSDDPDGDGGERMAISPEDVARIADTVDADEEERQYGRFMKAMVDHHIEDIALVIHRAMMNSGMFADPSEARSYLYTHEVPGGDWARSGNRSGGGRESDYGLLRRYSAPLLPDPSGNWTSVSTNRWVSPGITTFGAVTLNDSLFQAVASVSRSLGGRGNWGLMEWNPESERASVWTEALNKAAEYGAHIISLQGWEEITDSRNVEAKQALGRFLVDMGARPYRPGQDNRVRSDDRITGRAH